PDRDQDGEQCPAAADAVTAVVHTDAQIAELPGVRTEAEEEPERGPAVAEAAVLERGELVEAGRTENGGAHPTGGARRLAREPSSSPGNGERDQTETGPGPEIADDQATSAKRAN